MVSSSTPCLNPMRLVEIYGRLSKSNTARGSSTCPVTVGPLRYRASKSVLSTNSPFVRKKKRTVVDEVNTVLFYPK